MWLGLVPVWVRMMQCAKRVYLVPSNTQQMVNFCKYLCLYAYLIMIIYY